MSDHRRAVLIRAVLILLIAGAAFFFLFTQANRSWQEQYYLQETRETGNQAFMDEGIVEWNGNRYRRKPALTLILVAGIDPPAAD